MRSLSHISRFRSLALGIKMNILLFLPGLLVLLFQYKGAMGTVVSLGIIAVIQVSRRAIDQSRRLLKQHHSSYFLRLTFFRLENPPQRISPPLSTLAESFCSSGASTGVGLGKTPFCRKS